MGIVGEYVKAEAKTFELYGLVLLLAALMLMIGWNSILRADARALRAEAKQAVAAQAQLKQAAKESETHAEGYRTAMQACEDSKALVRKANAQALVDAAADQAKARADADHYLSLLQHPPSGCDAVLQQTICPALAHY